MGGGQATLAIVGTVGGEDLFVRTRGFYDGSIVRGTRLACLIACLLLWGEGTGWFVLGFSDCFCYSLF